MSFRTIRTDFNGVFLCLQCYIAVATHDEEVRCGAGGHSKSLLIMPGRACRTSTIDNESMALSQCPSVLFAPFDLVVSTLPILYYSWYICWDGMIGCWPLSSGDSSGQIFEALQRCASRMIFFCAEEYLSLNYLAINEGVNLSFFGVEYFRVCHMCCCF